MSSMSTPPPPAPEAKKHPVLTKNPLFWVSIVGGVLLVTLVVLFTILFTGGDDSKDTAEPQPSATVTVTPEPEPKETVEAKDLEPNFDAVPKGDVRTESGFSDYVRDVFPVLEDTSNKEITAIADETCDLLDSGKSFPEAVTLAGKDADTMDKAGAYGGISGIAVEVLCPEHRDAVEEYANS